MSQEDTLDVIVVGAGLSGLACAFEAAASGLEVIVLERGDVAGAKNLTGGRLYLDPLKSLGTDLLEGAPFERPVSSECITLCDDQSSISLRLDQPALQDHSVTVLRARLDAHLGERVSEKGCMVLPQQRVDALVRENGRVVGVKVGPEDLRARVVVAADGVLSFLAEEAGLRSGRPVHAYGVGIKEVVHLDAGRIEERFNLESGQGAARLYMGRVTRGLPGGGFLYTNRNSLSIGLVVQMHSLQQWKSDDLFPDLLEEFKNRPDLAPLVAGAETIEYGAHLIPEGGIRSLPCPGIPGLLLVGDAAGLVMNTGAVLRGMDLAMASGIIAGRSIAASLAEDKSGAGCLERYARDLGESFVMNQMKTHKRAARVLARERLYQRYPHRMVRWASELFRVGADGSHLPARKAWKKLRREVLGFSGLRDLWRVIRM